MTPPFPKNAPTLAQIKALSMDLLAQRNIQELRAKQWTVAACVFGCVIALSGSVTYHVLTVAATVMAALHVYRLWSMRNSRRHDWIKLPDTPITDTKDLQWLTWAQWKEPRTRGYLHTKRPHGDFRVCDIHDVMARMCKETDDFARRFGDPDDGWEALEERRKQERQLT